MPEKRSSAEVEALLDQWGEREAAAARARAGDPPAAFLGAVHEARRGEAGGKEARSRWRFLFPLAGAAGLAFAFWLVWPQLIARTGPTTGRAPARGPGLRPWVADKPVTIAGLTAANRSAEADRLILPAASVSWARSTPALEGQ